MNKMKIMAVTATGEELECFTWVGSSADGISRAWHEAYLFGLKLLRVWVA